MSMMRELIFFLGLQIKQTSKGIYIHQTKYVKELLKKFNMDNAKEMKIDAIIPPRALDRRL